MADLEFDLDLDLSGVLNPEKVPDCPPNVETYIQRIGDSPAVEEFYPDR